MKIQDEKQNQSLGSPLYMGGAALRTNEALLPESETPFCEFQKNLKALEGKVSRLSFMTGEIREILKKRS